MVAQSLGLPAGLVARSRARCRRSDLRRQPLATRPGARGRQRRGARVIALVSGKVAVRRGDHVVVDCGGVGYRLSVSTQTLRHVPAVGLDVVMHAHMVVRDDALMLYGFASEEERELFLMLLGVQSVGPKVALAVLSAGPPRDLVAALAAGDAARFQAVPGIGKRTAERLIVELREKVGALGARAGDLDRAPGRSTGARPGGADRPRLQRPGGR